MTAIVLTQLTPAPSSGSSAWRKNSLSRLRTRLAPETHFQAGLEADIGHGSFERGNPTEYMQASEGEWEISALRAQVAHLEDQIPETPFLDPPPEWTA
jgi:hypothetical protein